jgi:superfamily II DNA helicase RecQ
VLLTATLPPSQEDQLCSALLIPTATIIQARSTQRPRTKYVVLQYQRSLLVDRAVQQACKILKEAQLQAQLQAQETTRNIKEIIYCRSQALCKRLTAALEYSAYHTGVESRTEILQN